MAILQILGGLCILFAIADFGLYWAGIDLTGVSWSPVVAGLIGSVLMRIGAAGGDDE